MDVNSADALQSTCQRELELARTRIGGYARLVGYDTEQGVKNLLRRSLCYGENFGVRTSMSRSAGTLRSIPRQHFQNTVSWIR